MCSKIYEFFEYVNNKATDDLLRCYFLIGMHYDEITPSLHLKHNVALSLFTLKRKSKTMKLNSNKIYSNLFVIFDFMQNKLNTSDQLDLPEMYGWVHPMYGCFQLLHC